MSMESKKINDLIDVALWKKIQDDFSFAIKGTVFSLDIYSQEIARSKEFPFFCKMIHATERGKGLCAGCWAENFDMIKFEDKEISFYYCPAGLMNIMVPIKIDNNVLGCIICCSIVKDVRDSAACRTIASTLNLDNQELMNALNEIRISNEEEIKMFGTLLYVLSLTLPEMSHQKQLTEKKLSQLTILHKITQLVNSSLEIDKILKSIMNFMIESVNVSDCSIIIFSENNERKRYSFKESKGKYTALEQSIIDEVMVSKSIISKSHLTFEFIDAPKSMVALPLKVRGNLIGIINLYSSSPNILEEEEKEFLSIVADQVSVAIENAKHYDRIKELAITDKLTGLYNRRYFMEVLKKDIARSITFRSPLSVAMLDIDYFKYYNDMHGHLKGDKVLAEISTLVKKSIRPIDTAGRYGGEELIIISPETTNETAVEMLEKIRKSVEEYPFEGREKQPNQKLTISAGVVTCMDKSLTEEDIIKEADKTLYKAKESGRNKVMSTIIIDKNLKPIDVQEVKDFYRR